MVRKVSELMTKSVNRCGVHQNLAEAAHVMWDGDCGFVPVVDLERGTLVGVVTDRDACMAAAIQGRSLSQIPVVDVMSKNVATIGADDSLERAVETMGEHQLRRLPVVDAEGVLVGVLSMNDLFRAASRGGGKGRTEFEHALSVAMAKICEPHHVTVA